MKRSRAIRDVASSSGQGARDALLPKVSSCNLLRAPGKEKLLALLGNELAELHGAGWT
jgi:hypothetical protein